MTTRGVAASGLRGWCEYQYPIGTAAAAIAQASQSDYAVGGDVKARTRESAASLICQLTFNMQVFRRLTFDIELCSTATSRIPASESTLGFALLRLQSSRPTWWTREPVTDSDSESDAGAIPDETHRSAVNAPCKGCGGAYIRKRWSMPMDKRTSHSWRVAGQNQGVRARTRR
ncbi:hypothetical protein EJ03DRAFT_158832 [Teratosphaeria nubilosa]|uniref:Uncharacterized protein n=1 Tax=Teratosphaeria nubilosa TaxID=161662 RepID=A0A6G1L407_9PEZI|nr:hypothetical protein EJ03DRAFT_158832 [Teratosphaeria nubilosa]